MLLRCWRAPVTRRRCCPLRLPRRHRRQAVARRAVAAVPVLLPARSAGACLHNHCDFRLVLVVSCEIVNIDHTYCVYAVLAPYSSIGSPKKATWSMARSSRRRTSSLWYWDLLCARSPHSRRTKCCASP